MGRLIRGSRECYRMAVSHRSPSPAISRAAGGGYEPAAMLAAIPSIPRALSIGAIACRVSQYRSNTRQGPRAEPTLPVKPAFDSSARRPVFSSFPSRSALGAPTLPSGFSAASARAVSINPINWRALRIRRRMLSPSGRKTVHLSRNNTTANASTRYQYRSSFRVMSTSSERASSVMTLSHSALSSRSASL